MAEGLLGECVAGDAGVRSSYDRALGPARAALLLSDPPYCLLTRRRKGGDLRDKKDRKIEREPAVRFESVRDYRAFTERWLPLASERLEGNRPLVIWTNFLGKDPILAVAASCGYRHLWGEFVWGKKTTERGGGGEVLLRVYEVALIIGKEPLPAQAPADPPRPWSVVTGYDDEGEGSRWGDHPHHKPFNALESLVRCYSQPGDLILDPFAGSGSIPVAALRLERKVACLELRPEWAEAVTLRLREEAGRK